MKSYCRYIIIPLLLILAPTRHSQAQIIDAVQQALIAAIKAADLVVQQAQNATIDLQNAQKELENQLSQLDLGEIGNWEEKIKDIYSDYFTELWKVKTVLADFKQITGIIAQQKDLVDEYKQAYTRIQQDNHFSPSEVTYAYNVYSGIISESVKSVSQIVNILTDFSFQMSDESRMRLIHNASLDIQRQSEDLRDFNNQTAQISLQRAKDAQDINTIKQLYGIPVQ
jgi:hypothetical protein